MARESKDGIFSGVSTLDQLKSKIIELYQDDSNKLKQLLNDLVNTHSSEQKNEIFKDKNKDEELARLRSFEQKYTLIVEACSRDTSKEKQLVFSFLHDEQVDLPLIPLYDLNRFEKLFLQDECYKWLINQHSPKEEADSIFAWTHHPNGFVVRADGRCFIVDAKMSKTLNILGVDNILEQNACPVDLSAYETPRCEVFWTTKGPSICLFTREGKLIDQPRIPLNKISFKMIQHFIN